MIESLTDANEPAGNSGVGGPLHFESHRPDHAATSVRTREQKTVNRQRKLKKGTRMKVYLHHVPCASESTVHLVKMVKD